MPLLVDRDLPARRVEFEIGFEPIEYVANIQRVSAGGCIFADGIGHQHQPRRRTQRWNRQPAGIHSADAADEHGTLEQRAIVEPDAGLHATTAAGSLVQSGPSVERADQRGHRELNLVPSMNANTQAYGWPATAKALPSHSVSTPRMSPRSGKSGGMAVGASGKPAQRQFLRSEKLPQRDAADVSRTRHPNSKPAEPHGSNYPAGRPPPGLAS